VNSGWLDWRGRGSAALIAQQRTWLERDRACGAITRRQSAGGPEWVDPGPCALAGSNVAVSRLLTGVGARAEAFRPGSPAAALGAALPLRFAGGPRFLSGCWRVFIS
jgi:hypothetical protein